ncbi:MAG: DUF3052 family protein [Kofleriaceae bacterium]
MTLVNVPAAFARSLDQPDQEGVRWSHQLRMAMDVVVLYAEGVEDVERRIGRITRRLHPMGAIWVVWPKRRANGLDEDLLRSLALAAGMTASKVCALGGVWVGVRLVIRMQNRDAVAYRIADRLGAPKRTRRASTTTPRLSLRVASGAGSTLRRARARSTR